MSEVNEDDWRILLKLRKIIVYTSKNKTYWNPNAYFSGRSPQKKEITLYYTKTQFMKSFNTRVDV